MPSIIQKIKNWWSKSSPESNANVPIPELTYRTCIHEAGHYIMAYMFQDNFLLEFITFDKSTMDASWNGGFKFKGKFAKDMTYYDQLALIMISGICTSTILKHGPQMVQATKASYPNNAKKYLDSDGADVDYTQFKNQINILSGYFTLEHVRTQWNVFLFAFDFFLHPVVWMAVNDLATLFHSAKDQTHMHNEIDKFLKKKQYFGELDKTGIEIRKIRYPLTRSKLKLP